MNNYELRTQCLTLAQKLIDQGYMLEEVHRNLTNPAYATSTFPPPMVMHRATTVENLINIAAKLEAYLAAADDDAFLALRTAAAALP